MTKKWLQAGLVALLASSAARGAALRIYATTPELAALVREVGGGRVQAEALSSPLQNPHFVEPKPSLIVKLMKADAVAAAGLELEAGWLPPLLQGSRNRAIQPGAAAYLDVSEAVEPIEVPANPTRAMGDVHPGGNPHYLGDPENARLAVRFLAARLGVLSPRDKEAFVKGAAGFEERLDAALREWEARLAPRRGARFVSYHKEWSYFARRFGLVSSGEIEPKPGIPPSPAHTAALIERMKTEKVRLILSTPWYEGRTPEALSRATGARVLVLPFSSGGGYLEGLGAVVEAVAQALEAP